MKRSVVSDPPATCRSVTRDLVSERSVGAIVIAQRSPGVSIQIFIGDIDEVYEYQTPPAAPPHTPSPLIQESAKTAAPTPQPRAHPHRHLSSVQSAFRYPPWGRALRI